MPREGQTSITIPKVEWERLVSHFREHKEAYMKKGVSSPTALLRRLIDDNIPRFKHYNIYEDHAIVVDGKTGNFIHIDFQVQPFCELCKKTQCEHIDFLRDKADFQRLIRKRQRAFS